MACRYADDATEQSGEAGPEVPQRRSQGADLAALLDDSLGEARSFRYRCAVLAGQLLPAKAMIAGVSAMRCNWFRSAVLADQLLRARPSSACHASAKCALQMSSTGTLITGPVKFDVCAGCP